jgi:hypothetical protein
MNLMATPFEPRPRTRAGTLGPVKALPARLRWRVARGFHPARAIVEQTRRRRLQLVSGMPHSAASPPGRIEEQAESSQECALKAHGQQVRNNG